jgi:hypothetical protein
MLPEYDAAANIAPFVDEVTADQKVLLGALVNVQVSPEFVEV